jgi:hypothetical protein
MPVNFDNALAFSGEWVVAIGPEHPREKIEEICVWVYQTLEDGSGDVGATEMTTSHGEHEDAHFVRIDGAARGAPGRWLLPVKKVGHPDLSFRDGRAFAIAIALVVETVDGARRQRVAWWNQQVELHQDKDGRVDAALAAVRLAAAGDQRANNALREDPLATPVGFEGL